jgi:hypothetical protein
VVERLSKIYKMGSSDYSAMARPYVINLDVVGPLSVYVQVGFVRARLGIKPCLFVTIIQLVGVSG